MLYLEKPKYFDDSLEVAGCVIKCHGKILFLHRQDHKPQGNTWDMPAGKVKKGENVVQGLIREIKEESGLEFKAEDLKFFKTVFVKYPDLDFVYHIFSTELKEQPEVKIDLDSHKDFIWVTPEEALQMTLIPDEDTCVRLYFNL